MVVLSWNILTAGFVWDVPAILVVFLLQYDCPARWEGIMVVRVELIRFEVEASEDLGNS